MRTSLRTRSVLYIFAIVSVMAVVLSGLVLSHLRRTIQSEFVLRGEGLCEAIRVTGVTAFQGKEFLSFKAYVEAIDDQPDVAYALATDITGQVVAHSDPREVGRLYADPVTRETLGIDRLLQQETFYGGEPAIDIALPVRVEGAVQGIARIGMYRRTINAKFREVRNRVVLVTAVILAAVMGITQFWVSRRLVGPVRTIVAIMREMADKGGDLTREIHVRTGDELEQLGEATNRMRAGIAALVMDVVEIAEKVKESAVEMTLSCDYAIKASQEVVLSMGQLAKRTEYHSRGATESMKIISEISTIVNLMIENVETNTNTSRKALQVTEEKEEAVHTLITKLFELRETVSQLGESFPAVLDLAKQLAREAADEGGVARKRGAGKEPGTLEKELGRWEELLLEHQQALTRTIRLMDDGQKIAGDLEEAFRRIKESVQESGREITLMGGVAQELSKGSELMVSRINQMAHVSIQNADSADEVATATDEQMASIETMTERAMELKELGEKLVRAVRGFKIKSPH